MTSRAVQDSTLLQARDPSAPHEARAALPGLSRPLSALLQATLSPVLMQASPRFWPLEAVPHQRPLSALRQESPEPEVLPALRQPRLPVPQALPPLLPVQV